MADKQNVDVKQNTEEDFMRWKFSAIILDNNRTAKALKTVLLCSHHNCQFSKISILFSFMIQ